jgi:uncharacterized protein (DUF1015 family)
MAEVRPLRAVHYNQAAIPSLADVTAPPYDVIDEELRAELIARSPFNVVEIDLPMGPGDADPYEHAGETFEEWTLQGILTADREPAIWPLTQDYTAPDGLRHTRRGILAAVRVEDYGPGRVRPHERTQPGPKEDRLRLTRATRHNLSPIFSLHPGDAWRHVERSLEAPWGEVTDADETTHRVWRVADPGVHEAVKAELADAELLIADGHHRYETARVYADEVGDEGGHRYTLMCLVSLDDPGLTVFGTHRLIGDLADPARQEALAAGIRAHFDVQELGSLDEVGPDALDPAAEPGDGVFGYVDSQFRRCFRLRLRDTQAVDAAIPDRSEPYRRLDAAILEELILKDALAMSAEDIAAKRGIGYTSSAPDAVASLDGDRYGAAFLLRPTPIEQVRAVAAAGETMPPKSTYFYPKLLTGLVFNPLS